jgi:hypothetical protein
MAGIMTMIRISRIANIGFLIGWSEDSSDNSPIVSVTAYAASSTTVAAAERSPSRRAIAVNSTSVSCNRSRRCEPADVAAPSREELRLPTSDASDGDPPPGV